MRKGLAFTLMSLVPVAALSHCWYQNHGAPRGLDWWYEFGSPALDCARGVCCYRDSAYVVGFYNLYATEGEPCTDGFVMDAADPTGLWFKHIRTPGHDAAYGVYANASGIYVVGETKGSLVPGGRKARTDNDIFLAKYDAAGHALWARQFGDEGDDSARDVAADETGLYVVGQRDEESPSFPFPGAGKAFVRRYSLDGDPLWTREFTTPMGDSAAAVATDPTGVYVVGTRGGASRFTPSRVKGGPFVTKYDRAGGELWTRRFGLAVDVAMDVFVCGPVVYVAGSDAWPCVRKYDTGGVELWARSLAVWNGIATGVVATEKDVYVVGWGEPDMVPAPYPRHVQQRGFLAKYTADGRRLWLKWFGTGAGEDFPFGVAAGSRGLWIVGATFGAYPEVRPMGTDFAWVGLLSSEEEP